MHLWTTYTLICVALLGAWGPLASAQEVVGPHPIVFSDDAVTELAAQPAEQLDAQAASPATDEQAMPLGIARSPRESKPLKASDDPATSGMPTTGWGRIGAALGGTLLLAVGVLALLRKITLGKDSLTGSAGAPSGLVQVLARYPLAPRQNLIVLKLDRRILLLSQSVGGRGEASGVRTLTEITEPEDVASILLKTRDDEGDSIAARFREAMERQASMHESVDPRTPRHAGMSRLSELA